MHHLCRECNTGRPLQHNLVNIRFMYMKISDNVAEGMLRLQI